MIAAFLIGTSVFVPSIIPKPAHFEVTGGSFVFPHTLVVRASPEAQLAADALSRLVKPSGSAIEINPRHRRAANVQLTLDPTLQLGDEGYHLEVTPERIEAKATKPAGLFYAVQTLRQMMPEQLETGKRFQLEGERIACLKIQDQPRFSWRGMHLDESRHFYGVAAVKRYIDLLAMHKMNVFHWHLVDDGGWRIQIEGYPKLTEIGAWRKGTGKGWDYINIDFVPEPDKGFKRVDQDGLSFFIGETEIVIEKAEQPQPAIYGGYYTQAQIKDIVAYAGKRFVSIVPEIEMPGHALPAPFTYPYVGCDPVSVEAWKKATGMRTTNVYCAGKEATFEFIQNVLDEVIALFPSPFLHIGGDEVDKRPWRACPTCQKRMAAEGLKTENELQSYFVKRIEKYLNSKGKRMIGWDEILEGGLAPNATVMSWRGISGGIEAAKSGHDVVMSPTSHCYFDFPYSSTSTELVYSFEPVPAELNANEGRHVLGAQGNVWTEWMETFKRVEQMAYPRAMALAEVVWSPAEGRRWSEFQGRLGDAYARLAAMNVHFDLPQPIAKLDAILIAPNQKTNVEFETPPFDGAVIRYSTSGKPPTLSSPIYKRPIAVDRPTEVMAALFLGSVSSQPIKVTVATFGVSPSALRPGLAATVKLGRFSKIADMAGIAPQKTYDAASFGLGEAGVDEGFGLIFTGFIVIKSPGVYTFSTTSDDGSMLRIAGATVVDNDGLHGSVEKSGRIFLPAGTYPFEVSFFEQGGAERLEVSVTPPGGSKMPLPFAWLRRE